MEIFMAAPAIIIRVIVCAVIREYLCRLIAKNRALGFLGPLSNGTSDGGEYYFDYCSGHGECDIETRQCSCEEGYGDAGCGTEYMFYDFVPLTVVVCALSGILA